MHEQRRQYQQIIAKCWADEAFKDRILADPAAMLKAEGIAIPEGVTVRAVENTEQVLTFVIPRRPVTLSDADLGAVAGGGTNPTPDEMPDFHTYQPSLPF
jgi:hypothetical protein